MEGNIVLIGMPGSGKTTVGRIIAQKLALDFVDTDDLIRQSYNMELGDMVRIHGRDFFLRAQEEEILKLEMDKQVISTGGGVMYCPGAMEHLSSRGLVFYLDWDMDDLKGRLDQTRRLSGREDQDFLDLYRERKPLYERLSDHRVICKGRQPSQIADGIIKLWKRDQKNILEP